MIDELLTRQSLLIRLQSGSHNQDWEQFYKQYWAVILGFARRQGVDEFTARDVLQETMILLMRKLPEFVYDPLRGKFRNWLLTLVAGKTRDALRRASRNCAVSINEPPSNDRPTLEETLAADLPEVGDAVEHTWMQSLAEEALRRIQRDPKTQPGTFAAFHAYAIEGKPVAEVAKQFGLHENAVYQIKNRLIKRLREEVANLENSGMPSGVAASEKSKS